MSKNSIHAGGDEQGQRFAIASYPSMAGPTFSMPSGPQDATGERGLPAFFTSE
jgi:hypothetical protein